ncbi:hypothetical protein JWG45_21890 [Leptospira sp. 201903070]|uniref:DUF4221 domain-containing protein n=1 Tax=Leptospira ainlahdjerensis TaxID=2810033 RepID=A0ABS2UJ30_9LEPT|nr:hypothetical protein [Leptospira ainlahdjerensis]MBM9579803.1 hypothetical protein [Leptospira ainlahdjerensis]
MYKPQLKLLKRIPLNSANRFVIHKSHAFVYEMYGLAREIHVIDLTCPEDPKLVDSIRFQKSIGSLAIHKDKLYATESRRALHVFDLTEISNPKFIESHILLGHDLYDLRIREERAILAMNWEGIGIVDLKKPNSFQPIFMQKFDNGFVEKLLPFQNRFLLTNNRELLYSISILDDKLDEIEKRSFPNFKPSKIFPNGEEILLFGEAKKGKKEFSSILLLDKNLQAQEEPIAIRQEPVDCLSLSDGNILFGFDHSYEYLDRIEKKIRPLFELFEERESKTYVEIPAKVYNPSENSNEDQNGEEYDSRKDKLYCFDSLKYVTKRGNFLFATYGNAFFSFSISENSFFQKILE